jgi:nucleotide-binding universal stress UspA family protein
MNGLDRFKAEQEARRHSGATPHSTAYGAAINRYLGSHGYADPYQPKTSHIPLADGGPETTSVGTVVAGVDAADGSHVTADHAAIEAELRGCALRLVHAGTKAGTTALIEQLSERVRGRAPGVPIQIGITDGIKPVDLLLAEATATDLIVVGHRHAAFGVVLRHGVAEQVAARHHGPVLVVRRSAGPDLAAHPLVVRSDRSAAGAAAAEFALREARIRGCDVVLLDVSTEPSDMSERAERRAGVMVHHRTVVGDDVADELVDASRHACALVLGRGHYRLDAVGRDVLQRARCPVFVAG